MFNQNAEVYLSYSKIFFRRINRSVSLWKNVATGEKDSILSISEDCKRDKNLRKVNLGIGAYRDDNGQPYILPSVQKAKSQIFTSPDHEYLPIEGLEKFTSLATSLAYGNSIPLKKSRIASIQSISGSGGLRVGIEFLKRFHPFSHCIYIPNLTWGNHKSIIIESGLEYKEYSYYDPVTKGLDFENLLGDIEEAPKIQ